MSGIYILGAGGHGKIVLSTLRSANVEVSGFFDDAPALVGSEVAGLPVLGQLADFDRLRTRGAVIAIGDCRIRRQVAERRTGVTWVTAIHATAWVDPQANLGHGSLCCAGGVIQPGAVLGVHCIVNTGATVDHDCSIGDFVHICPGVNLGGEVFVGHGSWIGIGSKVIQGVKIGANVYIGAGSTVLHDIPDNSMVYGTPARVVRKLPC